VAKLTVSAADKVLATVNRDDKLFADAARRKLDSLTTLGRFGEADAPEALATFAATLATHPDRKLALEGRGKLIVAEEQQMFVTEDYSGATDLVVQMADLVAANPNDASTARMALQMVGEFENVPELAAAAIQAIQTFGPLFSKSDNEEIRDLASDFEARLRFLELPGKPFEISGTLLDGSHFDPKTLTGKVVLVDFWATWCGPCIAEMPNMLAAYEKYHDKGFEIVGISLDEERGDVKQFVAENKLPWPTLFAGKGWKDPVAQFYGISGIPQLVLIGRDGNVITTDVRGEKLGERLAELFDGAE
jgi:thiol-disulfide isomerase/thioredoxin